MRARLVAVGLLAGAGMASGGLAETMRMDRDVQNVRLALAVWQALDLDVAEQARGFGLRGRLQALAACRVRRERAPESEREREAAEFERLRTSLLSLAEPLRPRLRETQALRQVRLEPDNTIRCDDPAPLAVWAESGGPAPRRFYLLEIENRREREAACRLQGPGTNGARAALVDGHRCFFSLLDPDTFDETPLPAAPDPGFKLAVPAGKTASVLLSLRVGSEPDPGDLRLTVEGAGGGPAGVAWKFALRPTRRLDLEFREAGADAPAPCSVKIVDGEGWVYVPEFDAARSLVLGSGNQFYCPGRVAGLCVPADARLAVAARRGPSHPPVRGEIPAAGPASGAGPVSRTFVFSRAWDLAGEGWMACDLHTHALQDREPMPVNGAYVGWNGYYNGDVAAHVAGRATLPLAGLVAAAEDLDVLVVLIGTADKGSWLGDPGWFQGNMPAVGSPAGRLVLVGEEFRHDVYGHLVLFGMDKLAAADRRLNARPIAFPPNAAAADAVRGEGGAVLQAHAPEAPTWQKEIPVLIALGKLDGLTISDWNSLKPWYRWLNSGFRVTPVAETDAWVVYEKMPAGASRTYVQVEGPLTAESLTAGIREGRTVISHGPVVLMHVNGQPAGSTVELESDGSGGLKVEARTFSAFPETANAVLELVYNGAVVETLPFDGRGEPVTRIVRPAGDAGGWLAARCRSAETGGAAPRLLAHTAPVYVQAGGRPAASADEARYWADFTRQRLAEILADGVFDSEDQRQAIRDLYRRAIEVYEARMAPPGAMQP